MLEGLAERLIDELGFVVALVLLAGLLLEPQALFARDVQLRVTNSAICQPSSIHPPISLYQWGGGKKKRRKSSGRTH